MSLQPGEVFAGYTIVRELGAGGMGQVYLAIHPRLPRQVALKLLRTDLGSDPAFAGRFQREAATVAQLDHPNIVSVDDRGSENGRLWLSMPYIDGTNAEAALAAYRPGGMPPARAVHIVSKVAAALDFAHRHQLVHRDVKPANIMLAGGDDPEEPERVLLTDFGVVKGMGEYEGAATSFTTAGSVVATLDYAAPEQIEGRQLDGRTDVYALGCVLYKLLTGAIPYPGETLAAKVYAHLHHPPPRPTERTPGLPPAFDQVVATAMAADPVDRFQTPRALAEAARAALTGGRPADDATRSLGSRTVTQEIRGETTARSPLVFHPPGGPSTRPPQGWSGPPSVPPARTGPPSNPSQPGIGSPIVGQPAARPQIPPTLAALMQPDPQWAPEPDPSTSRRRQLWLIAAVVAVIAVAVTAVVLFYGRTAGSAGTGTPSNTASGTPSTARTSQSPGPTTRTTSSSSNPASSTVTTSSNPRQAAIDALPAAAADKALAPNMLLVSRLNPTATSTTLSVMNTDTGQIGPSLLPNGPGRNATLNSDRRTVVYLESGGLYAIASDGSTGDAPHPITTAKELGCALIQRPAWNPVDASMLVVPCDDATGKSSLVVVSVDGTVIRRITTGLPNHLDDITFAPNGRFVAFWGSAGLRAGAGTIYTLSLAEGAEAVNVSEGVADADPVWSPGAGTSIAFARGTGLAVVDLASREVSTLDNVSPTSSGPCWSPDGSQLAYRSNAGQSANVYEIWVVEADGTGEPRKLGGGAAPGLAGGPVWGLR